MLVGPGISDGEVGDELLESSRLYEIRSVNFLGDADVSNTYRSGGRPQLVTNRSKLRRCSWSKVLAT